MSLDASSDNVNADFTPVRPKKGEHYSIQNVGTERYLDLANYNAADGALVIAWTRRGLANDAKGSNDNQVWTFETSGQEESAFTLQNKDVRNLADKGIKGGYLQDKKGATYSGFEPFQWKLSEVRPGLFKIHPADNDSLALTSVTDELSNFMMAQAVTQPSRDDSDDQLWKFVPADGF